MTSRIGRLGLGWVVALAAAGACLACRARPGFDTRPNILLVTIDTVRADHVGAYGSPTAKTPTIDALAARGTLFEHAFTSVPATLAAHATILTGRLPPHHGVRGNSFYKLPDSETTLATALGASGYRTGAVIGAAVLNHQFGLNRGFASYDDQTDSRRADVLIAERSAGAVVSSAISWLSGAGPAAPFFLWVHLFDPHDPYEPPAPFKTEFAASPYDGEIAYADRELGRLLDALAARGELDGTLVVVTSDHGESLGEHGEATHGVFLYDSTLHVPLIVAGPGVARGVRRSDDPVGLVDVLPTLLARVGVPPPDDVDGQDLFNVQSRARQFIYAETFLTRDFYNWSELRALRSSNTKFVQAPVPEIYDLMKDPRETVNLAAGRPEEVARLAEAVEAIGRAALGKSATHVTVDADLAARLRSLGYVAGAGPVGESRSADRGRPDPKTKVHLIARLDEALALKRVGRFAEAARVLQAIRTEDPGNYLAANTLGDVLFSLHRDDEAIGAYRVALASGRETAYHHYRLAILYERRREYDKAVTEFSRLVRLDGQAAKEILSRGDALLKAGANSAALAYFEMLQNSGASDPALDLSLADTRVRSGHIQEAADGLRAASRRNPDNHDIRRARVEVLNVLGRSRGEAGNLDGAIQAFSEAASVEPQDFDTLANLGVTYARRWDTAAALAWLEKALAVRPDQASILNLAGKLHYDRGDLAAARALLERSLAVNPDQPAIARALKNLR
jgi:arylsulfatase A-like enzyme/Flp pilus assembly protein TadD